MHINNILGAAGARSVCDRLYQMWYLWQRELSVGV